MIIEYINALEMQNLKLSNKLSKLQSEKDYLTSERMLQLKCTVTFIHNREEENTTGVFTELTHWENVYTIYENHNKISNFVDACFDVDYLEKYALYQYQLTLALIKNNVSIWEVYMRKVENDVNKWYVHSISTINDFAVDKSKNAVQFTRYDLKKYIEDREEKFYKGCQARKDFFRRNKAV
jgi:hypothetical protein